MKSLSNRVCEVYVLNVYFKGAAKQLQQKDQDQWLVLICLQHPKR